MLERLLDLPPGIEGMRAVGRVTRRDYDAVYAPMVDAARREGRRLRLLYELGPELERFTPGGAWEDARLGLRSVRHLEGCAVVTDKAWIRDAARAGSFFLPCPFRVFPLASRDDAVAWLAALPEGPAAAHRLLEDRGVAVIEVGAPLRAADFDALGASVDRWIAAHGALAGLVVHARTFPGWENVAALLRHVRFVRDHHRRIDKVALAADSPLASLAPRIADVFVQAEVRRFPYDALDEAIAWAARVGAEAGV